MIETMTAARERGPWGLFFFVLRAGALAVVSPILEKNPAKVFGSRAPVCFSMSRVIVAAFAIALIHQTWHDGIAGWPEATLAIALVFAIPVLAALDKVRPEAVLEFGRELVGRFGVGDVRQVGSLERSREPSLDDDHTKD